MTIIVGGHDDKPQSADFTWRVLDSHMQNYKSASICLLSARCNCRVLSYRIWTASCVCAAQEKLQCIVAGHQLCWCVLQYFNILQQFAQNKSNLAMQQFSTCHFRANTSLRCCLRQSKIFCSCTFLEAALEVKSMKTEHESELNFFIDKNIKCDQHSQDT